MINKKTISIMIARLPLLYGIINEDVYKVIKYKWGGDDGQYHSTKAVHKMFPKFDQVATTKAENECLATLDREIEKLFACPECGFDIRKVGIRKITSGMQTSEMYIDSEGQVTRGKKEQFRSNHIKVPEYQCFRCNYTFNKKQAIHYFITNTMRAATILEYLLSYKKINIPEEFIPGYKEEFMHDEFYDHEDAYID
jgi:rubredoxin